MRGSGDVRVPVMLASPQYSLAVSHSSSPCPDQILFGLLLPGAELMLAASLHGIEECGERQMLVQHLDRLSSNDLLLLDRGYPSRWLVSLLKHLHISFCMRVEKAGDGGFACVREVLRSGLDEQIARSAHPPGATLTITNVPANPSRFAWFAMSRQTARCAC